MRIEQGRNAARVLRFTVDDEHEERWRGAAVRSGCSFDDWVVRSLDAAALQAAAASGPEPDNARVY
jgi:hypothetical protein